MEGCEATSEVPRQNVEPGTQKGPDDKNAGIAERSPAVGKTIAMRKQ